MNEKQVIVVRKDLGMRKGKMVAQGAHASMAAIFNSAKLLDDKFEEVLDPMQSTGMWIPFTNPWMKSWMLGGAAQPPSGFKKITVSVNSEEELLDLYKQIMVTKLPLSLILDSGLTEFKEPTYTALAVGPGPAADIDPFTSHLPLI